MHSAYSMCHNNIPVSYDTYYRFSRNKIHENRIQISSKFIKGLLEKSVINRVWDSHRYSEPNKDSEYNNIGFAYSNPQIIILILLWDCYKYMLI